MFPFSFRADALVILIIVFIIIINKSESVYYLVFVAKRVRTWATLELWCIGLGKNSFSFHSFVVLAVNVIDNSTVAFIFHVHFKYLFIFYY